MSGSRKFQHVPDFQFLGLPLKLFGTNGNRGCGFIVGGGFGDFSQTIGARTEGKNVIAPVVATPGGRAHHHLHPPHRLPVQTGTPPAALCFSPAEREWAVVNGGPGEAWRAGKPVPGPVSPIIHLYASS